MTNILRDRPLPKHGAMARFGVVNVRVRSVMIFLRIIVPLYLFV